MLKGIFLVILFVLLTFSFLSSVALAQATHTLQCDSDTLLVENLYVNLSIEISHTAACKNITLVNITGINVTFNDAINDFRAVIVRDVICNFDADTSSCVSFNGDISYVDDQVLISNVSQHFSAGQTTSSGRFSMLSHVGGISYVTSYVAELLNLTATVTKFTEFYVTKFASSLNNSGSFAVRNMSMVVCGNIAPSSPSYITNYFDGTISSVSSLQVSAITQHVVNITSSSGSFIYVNRFSSVVSNVSSMELSVIAQTLVNIFSGWGGNIHANFFSSAVSNVLSIRLSAVSQHVANITSSSYTSGSYLYGNLFSAAVSNVSSMELSVISQDVVNIMSNSGSYICGNAFSDSISGVSSMKLSAVSQHVNNIASTSDSYIYGNRFSKAISNVSLMQLSAVTQHVVNIMSSSSSSYIYINYFYRTISNVSSMQLSAITQRVVNITSSSVSRIYENAFSDTIAGVSSVQLSAITQVVDNIVSSSGGYIYTIVFYDPISDVLSIELSAISQDVANITSSSVSYIYANRFSAAISNVSSIELSAISQHVVNVLSSSNSYIYTNFFYGTISSISSMQLSAISQRIANIMTNSNSKCDICLTYFGKTVSSVIHLRIVNISVSVSGYAVNQTGTIVAGFRTASGSYDEWYYTPRAPFSNISLIQVSNVSLNVALENIIPANNNNNDEPFALTSSSSASNLLIIGIVNSDDLVDNSCSTLEINRISVSVKVINNNEANLLDRKAQNLAVVASENVNINNSPIRISLFSQRNGSGFDQVQISSSLVFVPSSLATVTTMIYLSPVANTSSIFNITNNSLTTGSSFVSLYHETCINRNKKPIFLLDRNSFVDSDDISSQQQQQQQQNSRILAVYRPVSEIPINFSGTKWIYGSNNDVGACNYFKSSVVVREFYKQAHFAEIYDTCGTSRTQTPISLSKSVSKTRSLSRSTTTSITNIIPKSRTVTQSETLTVVVAEVIPLPTALIVAAQVTNDVTSFISIGGLSSPISGASAARTNAITSSLLARVSGFCDSNENDDENDGNSTTTKSSSSSNKKKDQLPPARTVSAFQFKIGGSESAFDIGTVIGNLLLVFVIVPVVFLLVAIILFKYRTRNMKDPKKKELPSFSTLVVDSSCLSAHIFFYILYWLPTAAAALKVTFDTSTNVTFRVIVPLLVIVFQIVPMSVALVKHFLIHKQIETFVKNENEKNAGSENQSLFCLQLLVNKLINPEGEWKLIKKEQQKKEKRKKTQTNNTNNSVTVSSSETPESTITEEDKEALAYRNLLIAGYTNRFRTFICIELWYLVIVIFAEMLFYAFSNPSKGCLAKDVVVLVDTLLYTLLTLRFRPHQKPVNKVAVPLLGFIQSGCLLASILGIAPDKLAILAVIVACVQIPLSVISFIGFMLSVVNRTIASAMRDENNNDNNYNNASENTDESRTNLNSRSTRRRFEQNRSVDDDDAVELLETPLVVHSPRERSSSSSRTHSSSSSSSSSRNRTSSSKNEREQKFSHHSSSSSSSSNKKEKEKAYASSSSSNINKFKSRLASDQDDDGAELLQRPLVHSPRESSSSKSSRHHSSSSSSSNKKEKEKEKPYASSSSSSPKTKYNSNSSSSESKKESSSTSSRSRAPSTSSTKQHSSGNSSSKSSSKSQSSSTSNEKESSSKSSNSNKHQSSSSRPSSSDSSSNKNEKNSNKPTFSSSNNINNKKQDKSSTSDSKNRASSSNSRNNNLHSNSNSSDQKKKASSSASKSNK